MELDIFYIEFPEYTDERGSLAVIENLPFQIKRIFYIYNNRQCLSRGGHINSESNLILICLNGSCEIEVIESDRKNNYSLNSPKKGLFVSQGIWRKINFVSSDTILLAISDKEYNSKEYK